MFVSGRGVERDTELVAGLERDVAPEARVETAVAVVLGMRESRGRALSTSANATASRDIERMAAI